MNFEVRAAYTSTMSSLNPRQKHILTRNVILLEALREILKNILNNNIPNIILKGAAYLSLIYDNETDREMRDIDIFVAKNDLPKVKTLLRGLGYEAMPGSRSAMWKGAPIPVILNLHTSLWYEPNSDAVWAHSLPAMIEDRPTRVLDWEETVLFHIAQAVLQHGQWEKQDEQDLKKILAKASGMIRWDVLRSRASRTNILIPVTEVFHYLALEGQYQIPEAIRFRTAQRTFKEKLLGHCVRRILKSGRQINYVAYLLPLLMRPRPNF